MQEKCYDISMETKEISLEVSGFKKTKSREAILNILKTSQMPMTADVIYKKIKLDSINLSTVYRTLSSFVKAGLVKKEITENNENSYIIDDGRHRHVIICVRCHKKMFLDECPYHEANISIEKETGYKVYDHNIELFGLCPDCQKKDMAILNKISKKK